MINRPSSGAARTRSRVKLRAREACSSARARLLISSVVGALSVTGAASAACVVPNQLTNGQVADATQVMANFNAVATCANGLAPAGAANAIQYNAGAGAFGGVGPLANGQIVVGTTGGVPQAATITAGPGIQVTNGSGSITISASGSGGTQPTLRGTNIQAANASNHTVSWPTGTVAGDLAVIFVAGGYAISSVPSGWRLVDQRTGSNWNGSTIAKILTASDISTGSVTINMGSGFSTVLSIATFQGNTVGIAGVTSLQNASGASARTIAVPPAIGGVQYLYFASGRTAGAVTVNDGTMLRSATDGIAGSGALYQASTHAFFGSVVANFASGSSGDYEVTLAVAGP